VLKKIKLVLSLIDLLNYLNTEIVLG